AGGRRWEQLPLMQIHRQRVQVGTRLHGSADRARKAATAGRVTAGTTDRLDLMLVGHEADFRHIQDLTAFGHAARHSAEVRMALLADRGSVAHHFIWRLYHHERVPRMSRLPSRTLATRTTRAA